MENTEKDSESRVNSLQRSLGITRLVMSFETDRSLKQDCKAANEGSFFPRVRRRMRTTMRRTTRAATPQNSHFLFLLKKEETLCVHDFCDAFLIPGDSFFLFRCGQSIPHTPVAGSLSMVR